jgi:DNA polymerase-3 subunit gamma/tau
VVALLRERREVGLANHLVNDVHLVAFEIGRLEIRPTSRAPRDLAGRLGAWLGQATGRRWLVSVSDEPGEPTLADSARARDQELRAAVLSEPLVQAVLASFPGAEIHRIGGDDAAPKNDGDDAGLASGDEMLYDGAEGNEGDEQA